jgi:transcriptional regulator with XRE-family HTH domain
MSDKKAAIGQYLRDQRVLASLGLRETAARIGVSHVFLGEVERGRKLMPRERWARVAQAIPGVSERELEAIEKETTAREHMQLELRSAGPRYERLGALLLRRARKRDLDDPQFDQLLRLLGGDE